MKFENLYKDGEVPGVFDAKHGVRFARIPFHNINGNTEYYISEDGKNVYSTHLVCGWRQCRAVTIYPYGSRTKNSEAYFRHRNTSGTQSWATIPTAVYSAFVLGDRMCNFKLTFKDGDHTNCCLSNLRSPDDEKIKETIGAFSPAYRYHRRICMILARLFPELSLEDIQDIVSESYLDMCARNTPDECRNPYGLLVYKSRMAATLELRRKDRHGIECPDSLTEPRPCDIHLHERDLLNKLDGIYRETLQLVAMGYTYKETSEKLGVVPTAISNRMKKIRTIFEHDQQRMS